MFFYDFIPCIAFHSVQHSKKSIKKSNSSKTTTRYATNNGHLLIYKIRLVTTRSAVVDVGSIFSSYKLTTNHHIALEKVLIISDMPQDRRTSFKEPASSVVSRWSATLHHPRLKRSPILSRKMENRPLKPQRYRI